MRNLLSPRNAVGACVGSFVVALALMADACSSRVNTLGIVELAPATTDAEKRSVRAAETAVIDRHEAKIGYSTILRSGQSLGDDVFGRVIDDSGKSIMLADGSTSIADSNDFSSFLPVDGALFSIAQFESQPAAVYLTKLHQDRATGALTAVSTKPLDLSSVHGVWNPCAGMVTPWNSHLGSEEYEPDAKKGAQSAASMAPFFGGGTTVGGDKTKPNPYFYGYPVEFRVLSAAGDYAIAKHYSMGRFAHELSYVLPDRKTVYQTDDGTNVGLFMYIADTAGELTAGRLFALKWHQVTPAGQTELAEANLEWIELGHASNQEISELIATGITFADIFEAVAPADGVCPEGFKSVNQNGVGHECLALKPGRERAAAFLETRRYAGYLGATTELRKEEGVTFDPETKRLYVAYSEIQYGMEDAKKNGAANPSYDVGTNNDVKLLFNTCGAVYAYELGTDHALGSDYIAKRAVGVLAGRMTTLIDPNKLNPSTIDAYPADSPFANSTCDIDGIANPDNLTFISGRRGLVIGEDSTDGHQNDAVWAFATDSEELTRIETTPYGAETTSVYYYRNLHGFAYLMSVVQHPYGESDQDKLLDPADKRSYLGYLGPLPVLGHSNSLLPAAWR